MVRLLATVFAQSEPPAVAMGLSVSELEDFLRLLAPRAVADGLTVMARESQSGATAGVLLTDDLAVPPPGSHCISRKFLPIFALLDALDEQYKHDRSIARGECLHLFMLAVDPRFAGQGIAHRLVQYCLENGRRKGYRLAVTEATGNVSQHVFSKLGFHERFRLLYREFRFEGKAVFSSIREHSGVVLMEKRLEKNGAP